MGIPLKHLPASNTAAVISITALDGTDQKVSSLAYIELEQLTWSYDGVPTGGNLKVESPSGTTLFSIDITDSGPGFIPFSGSCLKGAVGGALIITLAAAGSGVTGKVNAVQRN